MKIYVASSWRNDIQPRVVEALRSAGYEVYDFKNPKQGDNGFHWSKIDPEWKNWDSNAFVSHLMVSPIAQRGEESDFAAMCDADACVLVLPCGRSAHLEAGYFVGANKPLLIYIPTDVQVEPELMYRMAFRCRGSITVGSLEQLVSAASSVMEVDGAY